MTARAPPRSTWRSSALTGPIEAGRIDRLRKPIAARANASIGRPASSPQIGKRRAGLGAAADDMLEEGQEAQAQHVVAPPHQLVLAVGGEEELLEVVAADRDEVGQREEAVGA